MKLFVCCMVALALVASVTMAGVVTIEVVPGFPELGFWTKIDFHQVENPSANPFAIQGFTPQNTPPESPSGVELSTWQYDHLNAHGQPATVASNDATNPYMIARFSLGAIAQEDISKIAIHIDAAGYRESTLYPGYIFAWNYTTGKWDRIGVTKVRTEPAQWSSLETFNLSRDTYMSAAGEICIGSLAVRPYEAGEFSLSTWRMWLDCHWKIKAEE